MSIELLKTLSLICFIVAAISLCIAGVLCFVLEIPKAIGYLTGFTAKKRIAQILDHSFGHTDPISRQKKRTEQAYRPGEKHKTGDAYPKAKKATAGVLGTNRKTDVLKADKPESGSPKDATSVLNAPKESANSTSVLSDTEPGEPQVTPTKLLLSESEMKKTLARSNVFRIEKDQCYLASDEIIE